MNNSGGFFVCGVDGGTGIQLKGRLQMVTGGCKFGWRISKGFMKEFRGEFV